MSKAKVAGVGARYGMVMNLDADGLPLPAVASSTPMQGTLVQGIKTVSVNDPQPRLITHQGDDQAFAQDSLPALEAGSFSFTTAVKNLDLDAMIEGGKVRTINNKKMVGGNTDNKGSEPQMLFMTYRQALDVDKSSASFGKLRQWELRFYPSARISKQTDAFEAANTDKTYNAAPSRVQYAPWFEQFNETNWGFTQAEYIDEVTDYQPRVNTYRGNGTLVAFALSHPPVDSNALTVWVDGTLTTPSSVVTTSATPAFTLSSAAGNNKLVFALIETSEPGSS